MAWTDPATLNVSTGNLITAAMWNLVMDNLDELKDPPYAVTTFAEGAEYTTTSTSFTDIDATEGKFKHTIVTNGGVINLGYVGALKHSSASERIFFNIDVDGATQFSADGFWVWYPGTVTNGALIRVPVAFEVPLFGLNAASHIFKLQWKVSGGTGTLHVGAGTPGTDDISPRFWVREN